MVAAGGPVTLVDDLFVSETCLLGRAKRHGAPGGSIHGGGRANISCRPLMPPPHGQGDLRSPAAHRTIRTNEGGKNDVFPALSRSIRPPEARSEIASGVLFILVGIVSLQELAIVCTKWCTWVHT